MWSCGRRILIAAITAACVAPATSALASAPTAGAASLSVTVTPTTVHPNSSYTITIRGHYDMQAVHTTPSLLAFIQYTGEPCQRTATAEYALPTDEWNWVFYPQHSEHHPSFKGLFYELARTRLGQRRVCAYLYPSQTNPQTSAKPLVRAGAEYTNVGGRRS